MPYDKREDLPDSVQSALSDVPHAQDTYLAAFNSALEQYGEESRARAATWTAVKNDYQQGDDGKWQPKDRLPRPDYPGG